MKKIFISKLKKTAAFTAALAAVFSMTATPVAAAYDVNKTVQMTDNEIDASTLAVGTHLIYITSIDAQIYAIARQSAEESGQTEDYYKSELEGGQWYNVTDGATIADISTSGKPVNKDVIEALHFNYYTMKDGLTYDLNSNMPVDIFDIESPYDADGMTELAALKSQYLALKKKTGKTDSDVYIQSVLKTFYDTKLSSVTTTKIDEELQGLEAYYEEIAGQDGMKNRAATVHAIMEKVDAERRAEVYKMLGDQTLQNLIKELKGTTAVSVNGRPDSFIENTAVTDAASEALKAVQESYIVYSNKVIKEGTTTLSKQEYSYVQKLTEAAAGGDQTTAAKYVDKITDLWNIEDNQIVDSDSESDLIDDDLLDGADSGYINALGSGTGSDYQTARENGSTKAVLDRKLKVRQSDLDAYRTELQYVIKSKCDRMANDQAQKFVEKRLDDITNFTNAIRDDEFKSYAAQSVNNYKKYLVQLLKNLVEKSSEGSQMAKLQKQKEALLLTKQDKLDENDLAGAKKIQAEIDEIVSEMDATESKLSQIIYSTKSTESEKAIAKANLGSVTAASDIDAVKQNLLDAIGDEDTSAIDKYLDGLASLISGNKDAGMDAMKEVQDAITIAVTTSDTVNKKKMTKELEKAKSIIADHSDTLISELTADDIASVTASVFGDTYDSLSDEQRISVLMGLSEYEDTTKDDAVENLLVTDAEKEFEDGNKYIYSKLDSQSSVFVNAKNLSLCSGYRYVFSDTQQTCILKKAGSFYSFKANDTAVKRSAAAAASGSTAGDDTLSTAAGYQAYIYIPADYVSEKFALTAVYLLKSDYGVISTDDMQKDADTFEQALEELAKNK